MDCLCNKTTCISCRGMMQACSDFIIYPGIYSANFVLEISSHTLPCHLTDDSLYPTPPLPISIDLRQHAYLLCVWASLDAHANQATSCYVAPVSVYTPVTASGWSSGLSL